MMAIAMRGTFRGLMAMTMLLAGVQIDWMYSVRTASASEARRPPMDRAAPETTRTTTFAMG